VGDYTTSERWTMCPQCGAAVRVPIEGGAAACRCGNSIDSPPRPDVRIAPSPGADEAGRRARLRAQDGVPLLPPPGCEVLVAGNEIAASKLEMARAMWGATKNRVIEVPGDVGAADRLSWLTMMLRNSSPDERVNRAVCEGALEAMSLPRHQQSLLGHLGRGAAREGDLRSADDWLGRCDPASEELSTDSAYRVSRATLETARGDFSGVLELLGASFEEMPIEDSMDVVAVVLRANALERSGRLDEAKAELTKFMSRGKGARVETTISLMPREWRLCAQSIEVARQGAREATGERAAAQGGASTGWIMVIAGAGVPLGLGIYFLASGQADVFMLVFLVFPLVFGGLGARMILSGRRLKEIARDGLHGRGTVLAVTHTGTRINRVPLVQIDIEVEVQGHPKTVASVKRLMNGGGGLVGSDVQVIWHPKYPKDVVLEA
jgi:hypothetical protein